MLNITIKSSESQFLDLFSLSIIGILPILTYKAVCGPSWLDYTCEIQDQTTQKMHYDLLLCWPLANEAGSFHCLFDKFWKASITYPIPI